MDPAQLRAAGAAPPVVVPVDIMPVPVLQNPAAPPVTTLLVTETVPTSQDAMEAMGIIGGEWSLLYLQYP